MSALGQKQTFALRNDKSALPPKAVEIANIAGADGGQSISALPSSQPAMFAISTAFGGKADLSFRSANVF